MSISSFQKRFNQRVQQHFHYAWLVVGIAFLIMLLTAATRATPSILMLPLENAFGWDRTSISFALSINLALFGLIGPFAAAAMQQYGIRKTVITALTLLAGLVALSALMTRTWHLWLIWGIGVGMTTGITYMTLGATIVNRWFKEKKGLAMGLLTASSATGQLIFLPVLAYVVENYGWQKVILIVSAAIALIIPIVLFFLPERPESLRLNQYGESITTSVINNQPFKNPIHIAFEALKHAILYKDFWLLFFSFFICGASTNGYIGTHFIAICSDNGITAIKGAGILALMGFFDIVGTTLSGWLSDRYNNRVLLFFYYGIRGLALIFLPYTFGLSYFGLSFFALLYGLDWIATVPPTMKLTIDVFGSQKAPIIFGWIVTGHQLGAAFSALLAGVMRNSLGTYSLATTMTGVMCLMAALLVLRINRSRVHPITTAT